MREVQKVWWCGGDDTELKSKPEVYRGTCHIGGSLIVKISTINQTQSTNERTQQHHAASLRYEGSE